jgi:S-adenosylmethionine-dependent methyltransferase
MADAAEVFDQRMGQWRAERETPWSRLRFAIVAHTLSKTIARLGGGAWRILDVGGGDGGDAIPLALAGHRVTVLDPSTPMLRQLARDAADAGATSRVVGLQGDVASIPTLGLQNFDLVLCHFVLQYFDDLDGPLALLAGAVRPGG